MNLQDFDDLATAQLHEITESQFFNNNTMNSVLTQTKLLAPLEAILQDFNHPFFNEAKALLTSLEFNFRKDQATGLLQIGMLDAMILAPVTVEMGEGVADLTAQLSTLKNVVVDKIANKTVKPFENATQGDFDTAKAKQLLQGETLPTATFYDGIEDTDGSLKLVKVSTGDMRALAKFDAPLPVDCIVELTLSMADKDSDYHPSNQKAYIRLTKGMSGLSVPINQKFKRWVRVSAKANLANVPFILDVTDL